MTNSALASVNNPTTDLSIIDNFTPEKTSGSWWDYEFNAPQTNAKMQSAWNKASMKYDLYKSNTAYQRAVEDMKKAGLNPYLAYSNGGFTPASSSSSAYSATAQSGSAFKTLITSAVKIATAMLMA